MINLNLSDMSMKSFHLITVNLLNPLHLEHKEEFCSHYYQLSLSTIPYVQLNHHQDYQ